MVQGHDQRLLPPCRADRAGTGGAAGNAVEVEGVGALRHEDCFAVARATGVARADATA
jgi:hypothetical protein